MANGSGRSAVSTSKRAAVTPCAPAPRPAWPPAPRRDIATGGLVFHVERGRTERRRSTAELRGVLHTPGPMIAGNWTVGMIVDERATPGSARRARGDRKRTGGRSHRGPRPSGRTLRGRGCEADPDRAHRDAPVRLDPGVLDVAIEGIPGASQSEPMYLDNVGHPAASRLALAKASRGHMHAFGIDWDETSGRDNGHFAPFAWSSS